MRRIALVGMSTLSGLVMVFSYHTSTNSSAAVAATGTTSSGTTSSGTTASGTTSGTTSSGTTSGGTTTSGGSSSSGTYTGDAVQTQWGIVQVQITVANGKITKSEAVQYPNTNHKDQEINAYAVPQLNSEVVAQQNASIDSVSGATVTTNGYLTSLQSALDQAHL
jgi:uncharacterized protein with FMN-binding domain